MPGATSGCRSYSLPQWNCTTTTSACARAYWIPATIAWRSIATPTPLKPTKANLSPRTSRIAGGPSPEVLIPFFSSRSAVAWVPAGP